MDEAEMKALISRVHNRKRYTQLDREVIAGIADADLVGAIEELMRDHVLVGGVAVASGAFEQLAPGPRALWATQQLDHQVRNGGFAQFFWNASGRYAPFAVEGLSRLGAPRRQGIVAQAIDVFLAGGGPAQRGVGRDDPLSGFAGFRGAHDFGALDAAYHGLEADEPLRARQIAYVRAHVDEFVLP
jgi:hypothetical protein